MGIGESVRGLVELTRPGNVVAASVLAFTGAYVAVGLPRSAEQFVAVAAAVVATGLATGAGNAVNDYFDREIDRINRPDRPIPRGAVSPRSALAFSVALLLGATGAAVLLPLPAIVIAVVNLLALVVYTEFFKGLPGVGNAVVAYLTGSAFLFGGAAVGRTFAPAVLILFGLAALATLTREIVKDVEDIDGDREEGLCTLPIAVGERPALVIGAAVMAVAVGASAVPYLRGTFGLAYLALVVPADAVMLYATWEAFSDPSASQRRLKLGTLVAAGAFIAGRTATVVGGVG